MATPLFKLKQMMIDACHRVYNKGWVASNDGNLSFRYDADRILCTPTGMSKGLLTADDLVVIDMKGTKIEGRPDRKPSSEMKVHLMYYEERDDIHAVVHAHPPYATGYALAGLDLGECKLPEVVIGLGTIPLTSYGLPGTDDLPDRMREWAHKADAFLMELHGVVTIGTDIMNAYFKMETVEHFAHIDFVARSLGGAKVFSRQQAEDLLQARERYGVTTPNIGCRAEDGYALPPGMALDDIPASVRRTADSAASSAGMDEGKLVEEVTRRVMAALKNG
jgi:L-fuculose-phosphate aldolase